MLYTNAMSIDPTEVQGGAERRKARDMSLKRGSPPTQVPGYEPERFLGLGAYGEVWVARERNTSRQVAIKFYAHRGGLDWSLLSREVEKLAFLFADRYVVQLLGVGWDADPPYYIMEYLERGSLADRIAAGPIPVDEAVSLFRDVATGLVHAHGKGVLHCDLKPANILLDQDGKPRLADFGQSRLSTEQSPALGTMFYMAPEQADLDAVPDARWDVYALGALLYCMLTGCPPHRTGKTVDQFERTPELIERLTHYRKMIEDSPTPSAHRKVHGVDKHLAAIVDRCLAPDPAKRFANVQAVLDALDHRAKRLARRPLMVLGAIGPALLLAVVAWFAWQGFHSALQESNAALSQRALKTNAFAAQFAARNAADELGQRFQAVEQVACDRELRRQMAAMLDKPDIASLMTSLADPNRSDTDLEKRRKQFTSLPERQTLADALAQAVTSTSLRYEDLVASWFFCDASGVSICRVPTGKTIGMCFPWRSYFHGEMCEKPKTWRPKPNEHIQTTSLSAPYRSKATGRWTVAISTPVFDLSPEKRFLGVLAVTAEVGRFVQFPGDENQFAVLVDNRNGMYKGVVIQHPLCDKTAAKTPEAQPSDAIEGARIASDELPNTAWRQEHYSDPMAGEPGGEEYDRRWLAYMEPIILRDKDTGWLVIVQEAYDTAIGTTLDELTRGLIRSGAIALGLIALVMAALWGMAKKLSMGQ